MLSFNKQKFASAADWLNSLKLDAFWLDYRRRMIQDFAKDGMQARDLYIAQARKSIGEGLAERFWEIRLHDVENTVSDLWEVDEITLPRLMTSVVGMLAMAWIETESGKLLGGNDNAPTLKPEADEEWDLSDFPTIKKAGLAKLKEAAKVGLIAYEGKGLLRVGDNVSTALVAYLCGRIFADDYPEPMPENRKVLLWKFGSRMAGANELDKLFGGASISNTRRNNNGKTLPTGHERVDRLFEN